MKKGNLSWKIEKHYHGSFANYLWTRLRINIFNSLIAKLKFLIKKPNLRIAISSFHFGGIGGVERRLKSIVESMPKNEFYVFAEHIKRKGFIPVSKNYYLNKPLKKHEKYDIYLYFKSGTPPYLGDQSNFRKKVIVTNCNDVSKEEHLFDYIIIDGENCLKFCTQHDKCKMVLPDVKITHPKRFKKVKNIPEKFFLTVFNPYRDAIKGYSVFYKMAKYSKLPIIWCYDDTTFGSFKDIPSLENVIQLRNLPQEMLYYLYSKAEAYICFSFKESFGWAIADALVFDLPIISRDIGITTFVKNQEGIHIYKDEDELKRYLNITNFIKPNYDKSILDRYDHKRQFKLMLNGE